MEIPVKNIKVKIKSIQGDIFIGDLNINGFNRLSDFLDENKSDFIKLAAASANGQGPDFFAITKLNICYINQKGE